MGPGAMIHIPSFIKIGSGIQKLKWGIHIQTHTHTLRQQGDIISIFLFFQNKESTGRLKNLKSRDKILAFVFQHSEGLKLESPYLPSICVSALRGSEARITIPA
jgi:hypothetical protein